MCDFHSICVRRDGAIAHVPGNSHSEAISAAKWRENDQMADLRAAGPYFHEAEWGGLGQFPGVDAITRGADLNAKQRTVIENHYKSLALLLNDPAEYAERMCLGDGIFAADCYADIRWKVLIHEKCPHRVAARLATKPLFADGTPIRSLHPAIVEIGGGILNFAADADVNAPALTKVGGYLYVDGSAKLDAPALTKVGGDLKVYGSAKLDALTEVGGYLYVDGSAKLDAPNLKKKPTPA